MAKPNAGEYPPYFKSFIDTTKEEEVVPALKSSGINLVNILFGMSEELSSYRYEPKKWSIKQLLGHIVDTEMVFQFRAMSFARGEKAALPGFDHDLYVKNSNAEELPLAHLLKQFEATRNATILLFEGFTEEMLNTKGNANGFEISLRALGFIIAGHQQHHLNIIKERYLKE
ncbi:MAG: hypothetical protein ACJAWV_001097 [Flammeovirgaceae bacterium]|jgi:hypothetical protein